MLTNAHHAGVVGVARVAAAVALTACVTLPPAGCALGPAPKPTPKPAALQRRAVPPTPLSPFSDAPVALLIHGNFARGEWVIVRVCLRADRSIASSEVIQSSGDARFDGLATEWAQHVRLRAAPADGPVARCGAVRVELHEAAPEQRVIPGDESLLG